MAKNKIKKILKWERPVLVGGLLLVVLVSGALVGKFDLGLASQAGSLPAFPGASGFGSSTEGGRKGKVIEVTNLNDTKDTKSSLYAGSLRWALEHTWPDDPNDAYDQRRIIVFKTGGTINAVDKLVVKHPFTTVAGQSAPGDGIAIKGGALAVETHDVVIRGLRFRVGDGSTGEAMGERDGLKASGYSDKEVYNVIFDHNSIAWAVDENSSMWDNSSSDQVHDITWSWNVIAEGLRCSKHPETDITECKDSDAGHHSMGMLVGDRVKNVSIHHNLLASNHDRNPMIGGGVSAEVVNNVVYNWGSAPIKVTKNSTNVAIQANILGNYLVATEGSYVRNGQKKGIYIKCDTPASSGVQVKGNVGPGRLTDSGDEWLAVEFESGCDLNRVKKSSSALGTSSGLVMESADSAWSKVLDLAGATAPVRDSVDNRIIGYVRGKTSPRNSEWFIDTPGDVGGFPTYKSGTAPLDTDHDGMPDFWELSKGLNINDASDRNGTAGSGYTWLEEYLNSLITPGAVSTTPGVTVGPATVAPIGGGTSKTTELVAIEDSYVRDGSHSGKNYGGDETLQSDSGGNGQNKVMYMKFNLETLSGKTVTSAKLKLKVVDGSSSTQTLRVAGTKWEEKKITFDNRPTYSQNDTNKIGTISGAKKDTHIEVDITSTVKDRAGQTWTLVIDQTGTDGLDVRSREDVDAVDKPRLEVTYL